MQFNSETNNQDLISDIDFWAGTTSSNFSTNNKTRSINEWYRKVNTWIWQATGEWEFDDSNYSTLPYATTDLVNGQDNYSLPTTSQKVLRVEVMDSAGNYQQLEPIDDTNVDVALDEFYETNGMPLYYRMVGRSIVLYPTPATGFVTLSDGMKAYFARVIDEFIPTDTTTTPGFNEDFHRILSKGAAMDYCLSKGKNDLAVTIRKSIEQDKADLQEFYGSRHRNVKNNLNVTEESII